MFIKTDDIVKCDVNEQVERNRENTWRDCCNDWSLAREYSANSFWCIHIFCQFKNRGIKMGLISGLIKVAFFLLGIAGTYFIGGHWLSIITTMLIQLTLLSLVLACLEPVFLFLMWFFILGVLLVD